MDIDMDMQLRHGHTTWIWTCRVDLDMQHGLGHAAWTWTMDMHHRCQNARMLTKSSVRHGYFFISLQRLVLHPHSGIMVSALPLVMD